MPSKNHCGALATEFTSLDLAVVGFEPEKNLLVRIKVKCRLVTITEVSLWHEYSWRTLPELQANPV
jgi:hypothetical protein